MVIRQLEYIVAVAHYRSFVTAADICCVTQPTLSKQVKLLEDSFGFDIFVRKPKPVKPTFEGEIIIEKAKKIVGDFKELEKFCKIMKNLPND